MDENIKKLEEELLSKIDTSSQRELEKVRRYINLASIFYELDESIQQDGAVVVTENASQRFTKTNPAIGEKIKISGQLLNIEKSFIFKDDDEGGSLI